MLKNKITSLFNARAFLFKFLFILLLIHLVNNAIIFLTLKTIVHNPGIPEYRLICSIGQIITLILFVKFSKPTIEELGLYWQNIKTKMKYLYVFGGLFVLLLV